MEKVFAAADDAARIIARKTAAPLKSASLALKTARDCDGEATRDALLIALQADVRDTPRGGHDRIADYIKIRLQAATGWDDVQAIRSGIGVDPSLDQHYNAAATRQRYLDELDGALVRLWTESNLHQVYEDKIFLKEQAAFVEVATACLQIFPGPGPTHDRMVCALVNDFKAAAERQ